MRYGEDKYGGPLASVESLEARQLLAAAWNDAALLVDQDEAASRYSKITGKNQSVALIDTGVDYNHPALGGKWGKTVIAGYDFVNNDSNPMDESGHGTQVAGVIAAREFTYAGKKYKGVAPNAKIVALRVADNSDYLPDSRIERALKWVIKKRKRYNITAVNISLGEGDFSKKVSRGPYADELRALKKAGVFIAAASGNEGVQSPPGINYPAADPNVMAVGSVNTRDVISNFTSRGPDLDLLAPGEGLATILYNPSTRAHTYSPASGTSFAAPYASATAMLIKQVNSRFSVNAISAIMQDSADWNQDGDVERPATYLDFPRLDIGNAIGLAYKRRGGARPLSFDRVDVQDTPPAITASSSTVGATRSKTLGLLAAPFNNGTKIEGDLLGRDEDTICG
jgi:subtilisin family serine protease